MVKWEKYIFEIVQADELSDDDNLNLKIKKIEILQNNSRILLELTNMKQHRKVTCIRFSTKYRMVILSSPPKIYQIDNGYM